MVAIPSIIDIRDDLRRARESDAVDDQLDEDFETVSDRLEAFADRDLADREGIVDEIDNELLRVEERLDQDDPEAARDIRSARNRLHIYRQSLEQTDEDLAVVDSGVRQHQESKADEVLPVGEVTVTATVANTGTDTEVEPVVTFYDEGDELESVRGPEFAIDEGEEEQIEMEVDTPEEATYYAVSVTDTGSVRNQDG